MSTAPYLSLCFSFFISGISYANTPIEAIEAATGKPIGQGLVLQSPKEVTRTFIDGKNLRIELGEAAVGAFGKDSVFQLYRGSAILESQNPRFVKTVNSTVSFQGKIVLSYDYKEKSSSIFVIFGEASIENSNRTGSKQNLKRFQGSTMITGDFYPSAVRSLDFNAVDDWLENYGWRADKRKLLLEGLPSKEETHKLASLNSAHPHSRVVPAKMELESYFPVTNEERPKKYEQEFTLSTMRGKDDTKLEEELNRKEKIDIITPEQAAVIVLPEIDLKPHIGLHVHREGEEEVGKPKTGGRKPASLQRTKAFHSMHSEKVAVKHVEASDSAVQSVLDRLDRMDVSIEEQRNFQNHERVLNDLRENF